MKRNRFFSLLLLLIFSAACSDKEDRLLAVEYPNGTVRGEGRIVYVSLEGGFFAITDDAGKKYDPLNLPAEYRHEGLTVTFSGNIAAGYASTHMWGQLLRLDRIERR